jgi:hypothetical protein
VLSIDEELEIEDDEGGGIAGILKPSLSIVVVGGGFFLTFCASSGDNCRLRVDGCCCCSVVLPLV